MLNTSARQCHPKSVFILATTFRKLLIFFFSFEKYFVLKRMRSKILRSIVNKFPEKSLTYFADPRPRVGML